MSNIMPRHVKVMLSDDATKVLGHLVAEIQSERGNYQIGVGTIAAEIIENIIAVRPDLIQLLLDAGGGESIGAVEVPTVRKKAHGEKKRAA